MLTHPKTEKPAPYSLHNMFNALFLPQSPFFINPKPQDGQPYPNLHVAQFFNLESRKISSAYPKTA